MNFGLIEKLSFKNQAGTGIAEKLIVTRGFSVFIREMTNAECSNALKEASFGRLGCAHNNQPYVLPINYEFDGSCLYGFTTLGQKVQWMRSNPLVCFEVDKIEGQNKWMSVVIFGRYEELPNVPEYEAARKYAYSLLKRRAMWWEPAYISQEHRDQPHSLTPIFFRIRIDRMTGHRATANGDTVAAEPVPQRQRLWSRLAIVLRAALAYFAIVFGAGAVLGPIRVWWAVPRFGERMAELLEAPLMLVVIILAARWVIRRFQLPREAIARLAAGLLALGLGLLFELTLVLTVQRITLAQYFESRDPVAATVYYLLLLLFASMPLLMKGKVARVKQRRSFVPGKALR